MLFYLPDLGHICQISYLYIKKIMMLLLVMFNSTLHLKKHILTFKSLTDFFLEFGFFRFEFYVYAIFSYKRHINPIFSKYLNLIIQIFYDTDITLYNWEQRFNDLWRIIHFFYLFNSEIFLKVLKLKLIFNKKLIIIFTFY